jgi:uncharacterized membrane protein YbhN (UPF0104 family)
MKNKKKISPFLILRLLGIALFVFILCRIDLGAMFGELKHLVIRYFLWGILFQILVLSFKGIRWHVMHEQNKNEKANSFIRVISERGFDVSIFVLIAVAALFYGEFIQMGNNSKWAFLLLGVALLIFSFLLLTSPKTWRVLQKIIHKFPGKFSHIDIAGKQYKKGTVWLVFLLSLLSNASYFVSCYFLALSVNLTIPLIDVAAGVAIAGLLNMLPVTIMGMGTRELKL